MKLLIVTQSIDQENPVLGFFHEWVQVLASSYEHVEVICLYKGVCALPQNVTVHSLGKEEGTRSRLSYAYRFLALVWQLRGRYDRVFVHMNQEYVLLAGLLWQALQKKVFLWRNHYAGSWQTSLAMFFCTKTFYTSSHSYTARGARSVHMPVGVALPSSEVAPVQRVPRSILFLSRLHPSKRPLLFLETLAYLQAQGHSFTATIVGSPTKEKESYARMLKAKADTLQLTDRVTFVPGVPHRETRGIFSAHEFFVNTSPSGMFDKTLFEAAASSCMVISTSEDWKECAGEDFFGEDAPSLGRALEHWLSADEHTKQEARATLLTVAKQHSLETLTARLVEEMK